MLFNTYTFLSRKQTCCGLFSGFPQSPAPSAKLHKNRIVHIQKPADHRFFAIRCCRSIPVEYTSTGIIDCLSPKSLSFQPIRCSTLSNLIRPMQSTLSDLQRHIITTVNKFYIIAVHQLVSRIRPLSQLFTDSLNRIPSTWGLNSQKSQLRSLFHSYSTGLTLDLRWQLKTQRTNPISSYRSH